MSCGIEAVHIHILIAVVRVANHGSLESGTRGAANLAGGMMVFSGVDLPKPKPSLLCYCSARGVLGQQVA
jgi:hypothetical protein